MCSDLAIKTSLQCKSLFVGNEYGLIGSGWGWGGGGTLLYFNITLRKYTRLIALLYFNITLRKYPPNWFKGGVSVFKLHRLLTEQEIHVYLTHVI